MSSHVVVIECSDYSLPTVLQAMQTGIDILGGITQFCRPYENIVLKPNLLIGDAPKKCTTTHPQVFQAIAQILIENKVNVFYGDSPGKGDLEKVAFRAGIKDVADKLNIPMLDFKTSQTVHFPEAIIAKQLNLAKSVLEMDGLISLPKLKTHGFTRLTGAVKNQFGLIPGLIKAEYHVKMRDIHKFSSVLVDINRYIRPRLFIMDAVYAMEGNGPRNGTPKKIGVLLLSTDPVAMDAAACRLIDLNPEYVPTAKIGKKSGLGTYLNTEIEYLGDPIDQFIQKDFQVKRRPPDTITSSPLFPPFLKGPITPKPVIDKNKCHNCGVCVLQCPVTPKAVNWHTNDKSIPPAFNYRQCIRCYCCQEMCPHQAIEIITPLLGRLLFGSR
jgi:uncharacterized protein (DUF362 family)/NAD-dependent dihydropyrimidine dehydrogenase PreA subunit